MAYLLSDLWIEMKYRLIKMFIVSLKISDYNLFIEIYYQIRVIIKLPNSEQSYKGNVKTHNNINRQNQSTTGKL
jgi:hypothetical protein